MKLYHATFLANLQSIFEYGLGAVQRKNWEMSVDGGVCFADDMELAISFCEDAENVSDEVFESGIVCLEVDSGCLLDSLLFLDPNWKDEERPDACLLYRGVVPPEDLKVVYVENDRNMNDIKEVNGMIIDRILGRKDGAFDGLGYDARDFYMACMEYGRIADGITRAMDGGTEEDVKEALCRYIEENEYNPLICDYIRAINWLGETEPAVELAAAMEFNKANEARYAEAALDAKITDAKVRSEDAEQCSAGVRDFRRPKSHPSGGWPLDSAAALVGPGTWECVIK